MSTEADIRILVVDDQQIIRDGIASLLDIQPGITVVGTATNGQEAVGQVETLAPDIVLMDIRMPIMDGIAATEQISGQWPVCQVIMLTTFDDDDFIIKSLQAGACGYLLKDIPAKDLAQALQLAHAGIYQLAPEIAGKLIGSFGTISRQTKTSSLQEHELTARELDVLRLIVTGATNREIAKQLFVSEGTVKNHVSNILSTLGLHDRTQAAVYALDHNLI
ncbi:response regulator transcription factor [Chloroflexi bacterium TSY]|nr:response regulator transcription factor [Chloroflexi bacterium TSY]